MSRFPHRFWGSAALAILVVISLVGCYTYYPAPQEALEQVTTANLETLSAALTGNRKQAEHWIPIYADWVRKLQVGVYLRTGTLSEYHRTKRGSLRTGWNFWSTSWQRATRKAFTPWWA